MLRYCFTFLIFQGKEMSQTAEAVQEFKDKEDMIAALISFAAMQSAVRLHWAVAPLYTGGNPINFPVANAGYGPNTYVVIKTITQI